MRQLSALVVFFATSSSTMAITGNQALELMTGSERKDLLLSVYADAYYSQEIVVRMNAKEAYLKGAEFIRPFCTPDGVSAQQVAAVIKKELLTSPEYNYEDLALISRRALTKEWQCTDAQLKQ